MSEGESTMFNREIYEKSLAAATEGVKLNGANILVTGATGLIGSFLVDALAWMNGARGAKIDIYAAGRSEAGVRATWTAKRSARC